MYFTLNRDIKAKTEPTETWVEAGTYEVLRHFDDKRVIIDITPEDAIKREITIVSLNQGTLSYDEKTKKTSKTTSASNNI